MYKHSPGERRKRDALRFHYTHGSTLHYCMEHLTDGRMKERMKGLSSSQNSPDFGFTPLSLSAMNPHSASHVHHTEEMTCSSGHDLHSLFHTPPMLSNRNGLSIENAIHSIPILYLRIPFTC